MPNVGATVPTKGPDHRSPSSHLIGEYYGTILGVLIVCYLARILIDFLVGLYLLIRKYGCVCYLFETLYGLAFVIMNMPACVFKATTTLIPEDETKLSLLINKNYVIIS